MKIVVEEITNISELKIVIKCKKRNDNVNSIVDTLRLFDRVITGKKDSVSHLIRPHEIYYFDSVDDKVFCYTEKSVYETSYKLYEIEKALSRSTFLRVNKSVIINVGKIECFKSSSNGRMEATLKNNDKIDISRNYVAALKLVLGGSR